MIGLLLIVFVSMLGGSLLSALSPFYALRLGASPETITLIMALYSACQFVGAPVWGRISDRFGRKPVLVGTVAGSALSFLLLAYADSLWLLVVSRVIGGFSGANIAAAYAYIVDITTPENRSAGMGKIGVAFGVGFVIGPAIGGFLAGDDLATANYTLPALVATAIALIAMISTVLFLKESRPKAVRQAAQQSMARCGLNPFTPFKAISGNADLMTLMLITTICFVIASQREATVPLWVHDAFVFTARDLGFLFGYTGFLITLFQGVILGRLSRRIGNHTMLLTGLAVHALGYLTFFVADNIILVVVGTTLNAYGTAVFANALPTVASKLVRSDESGLALGLYQSAASLGRFVGPILGGVLYARIGITAPFPACALILIPAFVMAWRLRTRILTRTELNRHRGFPCKTGDSLHKYKDDRAPTQT